MEDITDANYKPAKRVKKKKKNLGEYRDLYVLSDALLLAHVFSNFQNIYLKIYELDRSRLFFSPRISMASSL